MHFTPGHGWINDPLGLTFHDGLYHLFFQHVPGQTTWNPRCHWGHATSPDLLNWTELVVALAPGDGDDGCWSGCLVKTPSGETVLFYTSVTLPNVGIGKIRRARPTDNTWTTWIKEDIVAEVPSGIGATTFRDPYVFNDGPQWRMLVGAGLDNGTATALVFTSRDLETWSYSGPLTERSTRETTPLWTGSLWECPQLLPLGERHLLIVSVWDQHLHYVAYAIGDYHHGTFTPDDWRRLTYGPSLYASAAFRDDSGRPGLISWLRGIDDPDERWAGALSLPALLAVDGHRLVANPHPNVTTRRVPTLAIGSLLGPHGLDMQWDAGPGTGRVSLLTDAGRRSVDLHVEAELLTVTRYGDTANDSWSMPVEGGSVRAVVDGPILEVYTGGALMALATKPGAENLRPVLVVGAGSLSWWPLTPTEPPAHDAQRGDQAATRRAGTRTGVGE